MSKPLSSGRALAEVVKFHKTNADYQREHRARISARLKAVAEMGQRVRVLEKALHDVIELTGDKTGETAMVIRATCKVALR